jgi:uncharacterized protein DUF2834
MRQLIVLLILIAFGAYSLYVMWHFGYLGIWQAGFANAAALQILLDLVITCLLISSWMIGDARARGLNAWPFVAITLAAGSFGPLLYLVYRDRLG